MAAIREVMSEGLVTVEPTATVAEAATVMGERRVGCVLVMDGGALAGIFTERDIVRALAAHFDAAGHPVESWMTRNPITIAPDATTGDGLDLMLTGGFRHLPVTDGDQLVGVVSIRDLSGAATDRG
ncbi:MAG: CBS domain-containing protein [Actinobacteria bacterium]|nr:CBS domain-containing protein [Actinomycetota bacterium]